MDLQETSTHVFVIRLWLEEKDQRGRASWRGHITHTLTGKRRYLEDMEGISSFIEPYIQTMTAGDD
jgi:hypothetical protein